MGTIAEKLTYLNTTKIKLRDSLNKFGSNILSTDTFRSYDTKLNEIYDKLPKVTATGQGLTISNVQNGLLDDFKMNGVDLEQDTTTGKNLLNISDITSGNGIKNNNNKSITLNGNITSTSFTLTNPIILKANATYIMSLTNNDTNAGDSTFILRNGNTNKMSIYFKNLVSNAPFTPTEDIIIDTLRIYNSGVTFNNYTFSIQLEEGSSSTSFEPYTGGIPSPNPDYPQEIKVVEGRQVITDKGKNLFTLENNLIKIGDPVTTGNNQEFTITGEAPYYANVYKIGKIKDYIGKTLTFKAGFVSTSIQANTAYGFISCDSVGNNRVELLRFTLENGFLTGTYTIPNSLDENLTLAVRIYGSSSTAGATTYTNTQIEINPTATDYEPYYEPVDYNIDLSLENIQLAKMPNTTYKNRIYKSNGNWYYEENPKKVILDGSENWYYVNNSSYSESIIRYRCDDFTDVLSTGYGAFILSSNFKGFPLGHRTENGIARQLDSSGLNIFIDKSITNNSLTNFKNWLSTNNVEVWYPLDNPITTQITNTTLINQLEDISVHTGTNIITISNDNNIIPEIEITRLKELEKLS